MNTTAHSNHLRGAAAAMAAMIAVVLVALAGAKPAEAAFAEFPDGHGPIAFERDGDIWVATMMHLGNLTPHTTDDLDVDPAVSPDGRYVAFSSDGDGYDFEIYTVDVFTGDVRQVTNNTVSDFNSAWSPDGRRITHEGLYHWMNIYSFTRGTSKAFE